MKKILLLLPLFLLYVVSISAQEQLILTPEEQRVLDSLVEIRKKIPPVNPDIAPMSSGRNPTPAAGSIHINRDAPYNATTYSPTDLLNNVFVKGGGGPCATGGNIKNVSFYGTGWSGSAWTDAQRSLSYFKNGSAMGMADGLIMGTGPILTAEGPNALTNGLAGGAGGADPDISSYMGISTYTRTYLEFDFIPLTSTIKFEYIFASEEYPEYVGSIYNDAFAFFVSGPGVPKQNIAVLPNGTGVAINSINHASNSAYYVNGAGSALMEYDGRTTLLETKTVNVTPGQTYRMKLVIGNGGSDNAWGSAVFLKAGSFDIGLGIRNIINGNIDIDQTYENCSNNKFRITLSPLSTAVNATISYTGAAASYLTKPDGTALPTTVSIPAGTSTIEIPYKVKDNLATNGSSLTVSFSIPNCGSPQTKTIKVFKRPTNITATGTDPCSGQNNGSIAITATGGSGTYETSINNGVWTKGKMSYTGLAAGTYTIKLRDVASCNEEIKTVVLKPLTTNAGPAQSSCGNVFTMNAPALATGETGKWTVVSGTATITANTNPKSTVTVTSSAATLRWTVTKAGCSAYGDVVLTVYPKPVVPAIGGPAAVCAGSTITLTNTTTGGTWSSNNTGIATINASGVLTGVAAGTAVITYTVTNANKCSTSVTKSITVNALPTVNPITGPTPMTSCIGGTLQLANATTGGTWSSDNTGIATVNAAGLVTGVSAGTVTIRYTVKNANNCSKAVTASVTVMSNPTITISSATINEGGNLEFTVTRTGATCSPSNFSVKYQTVDDDAASPADYTAASGTLTFTPSETSKKIVVATRADNIVEGNEKMKLRLSGPVNCVLSGGGSTLDAVGTIIDQTDGTIIVEKYMPLGTDASEPAKHGSFKIRFANTNVTCKNNVKVNFSLSGALSNKDYTVTLSANVTATTATIPKNTNHIEIPIKVVNNYVVEGIRILNIKISNPVQF